MLRVSLQEMQPLTRFASKLPDKYAKMAREAGIHTALWRPSDLGYTCAQDLIDDLDQALQHVVTDPDRFIPYGDIEEFRLYVDELLTACREFPDAVIEVDFPL